ncbi:N-acetylmuramoyl-L-alanine amidase [Gloeobacter kilaueensis]|uniref:N-acetylmuramoyl-L-alanine amidase n=1 Tax=Gloeobacter kilaueensis (strain ATCC BAA-2537 / CCAP 1431/1 / ULC 316 / JS1) TaxID=1183438 RepID=U5QIF6_GLOK1|nr:N-acetylmuramoyl-L-alanine amidase [Gloeobacter kilaueensis]AGY58716.1 N-acetylmuramoyl-L-alanine amidase [Gloeobacter kilaueensis JS1]
MNSLLRDLVNLYAALTIEFPQLKAVTLAQWLLESGRATSALAQDHYNFGGIKWREEMQPYATKVSYDASDGRGDYCDFGNLEDFIRGYWFFIDRPPYAGWRSHTATGQEFIEFIGPIYAPAPSTPSYAQKVLNLLSEAAGLLDDAPLGDDASDGPVVVSPPAGTAKSGVIVLDPGHGGTANVGGSSANNATSFSGILEKQMTLDLARRVQQALGDLAAAGGHDLKVFLTRSSDVNIGIQARARTAKAKNADLFLSLHFNAFNGQSSGTEAFIRSRPRNVNYDADLQFATRVQSAVLRSLRTHRPATRDRGVKVDTTSGPGGLGVLNDPDLGNTEGDARCRACLVETEFIDVKEVDDLLNRNPAAPAVRRDLALAIATALIDAL